MAKRTEPLIIVVSAPSGSGKTTIVKRLLEELSGIERAVSYTTRKPRGGEKEGEDYVFISEEEFEEKQQRGDFLEWENNFGHNYGTSVVQLREAVSNGRDIILNIDVKGARTVKKLYPGSVSVFIMPPSKGELEKRLKERNADQEDQVSMRLQESRKEIDSSDEFDYMIVNRELEEAIKELKTIITAEKDNRTKKKKEDAAK